MLPGVVGPPTSWGPTSPSGTRSGGPDGSDLLAALLDGMDAALCAFDADGVVTHWNREAERILGWTAAEAVGRHGFAGWAVRQRGRRGGRGAAAVRHAGARAAGARVRAADQGRRAGARADPVRRGARAPTGSPPGCTAPSARCTRRSTWSGPSRSARRCSRTRPGASCSSTPICGPPWSTRTRPARSASGVRACWGGRWASCSPRAWRSWRARSRTCSPRARRPRPPRSG